MSFGVPAAQSAKLWDRFRVRVIVSGVCDSHRMALSDTGFNLGAEGGLAAALQAPAAVSFNPDTFASHIRAVSGLAGRGGCGRIPVRGRPGTRRW